MDWKLCLTTFISVFVAELGDKTQLMTLSLASGNRGRWAVFAGSACALVLTSAIAVLIGAGVARIVPPIWLKRIAAVVFLVFGVVFLVEGFRPSSPDLPDAS